MKKLTVVFLLLLVFLFPVVSQQVEGSSMQYETISWEPVAKSKKYEIYIEKLNEKGKWISTFSKSTKDTSMEVLLEPGNYRVAIATFNVLGKKNVSEWTTFYILDGNIPYLFNNYYEKSNEWKVPILYVDFKHTDMSSVPGSKNFIKTENENMKNTLFIKGKNIFSPTTSFYLVPSDNPIDGGKPYPPFYDGRKEVPLNIVKRDTKKSGVYVSYEPEALFSGYYYLEARNGKESSAYGILVFAERPLEMTLEGFEHNQRYKVNALNIDGEREVNFSVIGKGFNSNTKFTLIPTDAATIDYPYASTLPRNMVPVNMKTKDVMNSGGLMKLELVCNTKDLRTGYYYVQAENSKTESTKCLFLAKISVNEISDMDVKKVITRFNKSSKNLDISVLGRGLDKVTNLSLLSAYSKETDNNNRIDFPNVKSMALGTRLQANIPAEKVSFGTHALVFESPVGASTYYINVDRHYKAHLTKMDEEKVENLFLRPEEGNFKNIDFDSNIQENVSFENDKIEVKSQMPYFFPYTRIVTTPDFINTKSGEAVTGVGFEVDFLNFGWLFFDIGGKYNYHAYLNSAGETAYHYPEVSTELFMRFCIPGEWFSPFFGLGTGYNLIDPNIGFNIFNTPMDFPLSTSIQKDGFLNSSDLYFTAQLGVVLMSFFDVRYSMEFHNFLNENVTSDIEHKVSIGARLPIRRTTYTRRVLTQGATITKGGEVHAADYNNLGKVTTLEFDEGVTEINGFVNYNKVEKIVLSKSVRELGPGAFKNCANLQTVSIPSNGSLSVIREEAFSGDKLVREIYIPSSVVKIEKNAFEGWGNGQIIHLGWKKDANVTRNLSGLENIDALIYYSDNTMYRNFNTPFNDISNWKPCVKGVIPYFEYVIDNGANRGAIRLYGTPDNLQKHTTTPELAKLLKTTKSVSFKILGDGNTYMFYVGTKDGNYYTQEFKTRKEKTTSEKINIKSLKLRTNSNERKLDVNKIAYVQILPVPKGKKCNAYFYDFEVEPNE